MSLVPEHVDVLLCGCRLSKDGVQQLYMAVLRHERLVEQLGAIVLAVVGLRQQERWCFEPVAWRRDAQCHIVDRTAGERVDSHVEALQQRKNAARQSRRVAVLEQLVAHEIFGVRGANVDGRVDDRLVLQLELRVDVELDATARHLSTLLEEATITKRNDGGLDHNVIVASGVLRATHDGGWECWTGVGASVVQARQKEGNDEDEDSRWLARPTARPMITRAPEPYDSRRIRAISCAGYPSNEREHLERALELKL